VSLNEQLLIYIDNKV